MKTHFYRILSVFMYVYVRLCVCLSVCSGCSNLKIRVTKLCTRITLLYTKTLYRVRTHLINHERSYRGLKIPRVKPYSSSFTIYWWYSASCSSTSTCYRPQKLTISVVSEVREHYSWSLLALKSSRVQDRGGFDISFVYIYV